MKRKDMLKGMAAAAVVAPASMASMLQAQDGKKKDEVVDFLFVQNSTGVSLKDGVLTLKGVTPDTLYFSDRPERITGRYATAEFVEQWASGSDSFKKDPPNAVLTVLDKTESDVVVVLKKPRLKDGNLIYDVEVTDGEKSISGGAAALFIDVIGRPLTPMSYAGMARRVSRRTARRVSRRR